MATPNNTSVASQIESLKRKQKSELRRRLGVASRLGYYITGWLSRGIAVEAHGDWLRVKSLLNRRIAEVAEAERVSTETVSGLATAGAYLELARETRDISETWSFVNEAELTLCNVSDPATREQYLERARGLEPILQRLIKGIYPDISNDLRKERQQTADPCKLLSVHAQQWHFVNQDISLSLRVWRLGLKALIFALLFAVGTAELLSALEIAKLSAVSALENTNEDVVQAAAWWPPAWWPPKYFLITVLGFFGAALSLISGATARRVRAPTYRQERSQIWISLLLGASGAFVLYTLVEIPHFLKEEVKNFLTGTTGGFIALGIAAGYSERLWRTALDTLASKFPTRNLEEKK